MDKVHLTIALTTLRKEPRFDLLVESLIIAAAKYPMITWEFLCIDGILWYDKDRAKKLADIVRGRFPYRHIPPKPSVWQGPTRFTSKDYWDACGARNTAIIYALGTQVVFIDDCMEVPEDFFFHHFAGVLGNHAVAGGYTVHGEGGNDHRLSCVTEPQFVAGGWTFGMNVSFPMHFVYKVNGYDELYSGAGGVEDCEIGIRLERAGCKLLFNPDCVVIEHYGSHDHADWGREEVVEGKVVPKGPKEKMLADGKMHYANEYLIHKLCAETERYLPLGNRFSLYELRKLALEGKPMPIPTWPTRDWRDLQPLAEM